jgi:hypothetical protein
MHMEKKRIEIGLIYSAKVGSSWLPVRIDESLGHGRYGGASMPSGVVVKVSTDAIRGDGQTVEDWTAKRTPKEEPPAADFAEAPAPAGDVGAGSKKLARAKVEPADKKDRKPSGLDAAATVLAEAGEPLNCAEMVKRMLEKGLWQTGGKTPASTIYAAILREINAKGDKSRFKKTNRGLFDLKR